MHLLRNRKRAKACSTQAAHRIHGSRVYAGHRLVNKQPKQALLTRNHAGDDPVYCPVLRPAALAMQSGEVRWIMPRLAGLIGDFAMQNARSFFVLPIVLVPLAAIPVVLTELASGSVMLRVDDPPATASCTSLTTLLLRDLGLNPQVLAAIGATEAQTETIVTAALGMCAGQGQFAVVQNDIETAKSQVQELESKVNCGGATDLRIYLEAARADLDASEAARDTILAQLQVVIESTLSEDARDLLANILAAKTVSVPVHYKAVLRPDADWVTLRNDLAEERRAAIRGVSAPSRQLQADEPDVQAAEALLIANLAGITEAWNDGLGL